MCSHPVCGCGKYSGPLSSTTICHREYHLYFTKRKLRGKHQQPVCPGYSRAGCALCSLGSEGLCPVGIFTSASLTLTPNICQGLQTEYVLSEPTACSEPHEAFPEDYFIKMLSSSVRDCDYHPGSRILKPKPRRLKTATVDHILRRGSGGFPNEDC